VNKLAERGEERHRICCNCGAEARLLVEPVVPYAYGGKMHAGNEVAVCRDCDLLRFNVTKDAPMTEPKMLNVWLSHELHERVMEVIARGVGGVSSLAGLTRYLLSKYLSHPEHYDDVGSRQDQGMGVKVNFWVSREMREQIKEEAAAQRLTVADVVKGLFLLYLEQTDSVRGVQGVR